MGRAGMWLHEADPTRPVMICLNRADLTEFGTAVNDQHYYPFRHPEFREPTEAPVLFGEFHALPEEIARLKDRGFVETWGRSLLLEWTEFQKRPWVAGGLICCWDDGSVNGNLGPRQWGVVDSRRHAKDVHYHIRKVFAPVRLSLRRPEIRDSRLTGVLVIANRYSFTDMDGYRFEWKLLTAAKVLSSGAYSWCVPPGETGEFPLSLPVATRPERLEVSVFDRQGYCIQEESFRLPAAEAPSDLSALLAKIDVKAEAQLVLSGNELQGRGYVARLTGAGRIEIGDREDRALMSIDGAVLQKGRSRQPNVPIGPIKYGSPRTERNSWIVPVAVEGKITGEMNVAFGPAWMRVSYELEAGEAQAIRESGTELKLAADLSRLTWNRDALWNTSPPGRADGTLESIDFSDFARTISRRNVRWAMAAGKDRAVLLVPIGTYTNIRATGDSGVLVMSDYLGAGDFLGKFDSGTTEKRLNPGEKITGGFTIYFLTPGQAAKLRVLPTPEKDLTWLGRVGSGEAAPQPGASRQEN